MTGIGSSLESRDHVISGREIIYDLSLPFIAPLQPENNINHQFYFKKGQK
jgi:hypothetical protein